MDGEHLRSTELEETFFLSVHSPNTCRLKLSSDSLSITTANEHSARIAIEDIYGCLCMKPLKNPVQCHFVVYLYVLKQAHGISAYFSKGPTLHRWQKVFTFGKYDDYERNFSEVVRWYRHLTEAIFVKRNLPLDIVRTKRDKRALVFVNPAGGAGKAYRLVMEHVVGVWSEAEFPYQIVITEYAGHARDFVQSLDLNEWSGIVVASGDGVVYEVLNGLFSRQDWQEALKLPIGHLPCGSANALITNIIRHSKQPIADSTEKFVVQSAILIATHQVLPFDMAVIDTCDGQRLFAFLSVEWAIIADVDCDSEKYRFLGGTRFTVEAIKRIIQPRVYTGYVDYLPYNAADAPNSIPRDTPIAQLHHHLPPLNEPLPASSEWRRIDGPFAHVLITSKAAISKDTVIAPQSTLTDNYLTLQYVLTSDASRMNLAKTFTKIDDGSHFEYDFVHWLPVRAFRIVPSEADGNLMVDGEKVPYGPIQGEVLPGIARCMGKQPRMDQ